MSSIAPASHPRCFASFAARPACAALILSAGLSANAQIDQDVRPSATTLPIATAPAATPAARPAVGDPAPPIDVETWLNGPPLELKPSGPEPILMLTFLATWSDPSRESLGVLRWLHDEYGPRGVVVAGITDEPVDVVRVALDEIKPPLPFRLGVDRGRATTTAWCEQAGIGFVPYTFVIGADRRIAWHGHPRQAELRQVVEALVTGTYDREQARRMVLAAWSVDQLEAMFRDACAEQAWHAALLALDALLQTDVPKGRLLRYKLSILLAELERGEDATTLVAQMLRDYADDAAFLNRVAWDLVSDPRLYVPAPELGLRLAQAAYRRSAGKDSASADTYARALYLIGRVDLAIGVQERAVAAAIEEHKPRYERTLAFYRRCLALQKEVDAPSPGDQPAP